MSKSEEKRWGKFESVAIINGKRGTLKISQIKPATYIYDVMARKISGRNRSCLERRMRTCLTDFDLIEFEHSAQKMSGSYIIKIDTVKLTCHNFIALTFGIIRIAYDIDEHP